MKERQIKQESFMNWGDQRERDGKWKNKTENCGDGEKKGKKGGKRNLIREKEKKNNE